MQAYCVMPKPNFAFQKRQRELEKKRKKADKDARKNAPPATSDEAATTDAPATADAPAQLDPSQPVPEMPKE